MKYAIRPTFEQVQLMSKHYLTYTSNNNNRVNTRPMQSEAWSMDV